MGKALSAQGGNSKEDTAIEGLGTDSFWGAGNSSLADSLDGEDGVV
jgi:hypothetical protein